MTRFLFTVATIVLVGIVSLFAQDPGRAEISGRVVTDNASLPGVRVSAIGAGTERSVITSDAPGFTNGMSVEAFLAALRLALRVREAPVERNSGAAIPER